MGKDVNEFGKVKRNESEKSSEFLRERVRLGKLVLQCSNGGGLTAPDWNFILQGISAIDEVTITGLVTDMSAAIHTVNAKLKEYNVFCGRMTVEVTV